MIVWLLLSLFVFIAMGIPIAFSIGLSSLLYLVVSDIPLSLIAQRSVMGVFSYSFLAIPFFVLSGMIMERGGTTRRLMKLANSFVGHFKGGLAVVDIVVSMMFAALSGSGVGGTAAVGAIMIPSMKKKGYSGAFAAAVEGTSGVLASIIPPSLTIVIIGVTGGVSIGRMFFAGIVPGIICGLALIVVALIISRKRGYGGDEKSTWRARFSAMKHAILPLVNPIIILGGIFGGIFTVTEAAVVSVVYSLILSMVIYREMDFKDLIEICIKTIRISCAILIIIAISSLFAWILTAERVPQRLTVFFSQVSPNKYVFFLYINMLLLLLGTFMESSALVLILIPTLLPVAAAFGIDPVHFGIIFLINLTIGANTPPLGVTLMTGAKIAEVPFYSAAKEVIPFLGAMVVALLLFTVFPQIVLWLPNMVFG